MGETFVPLSTPSDLTIMSLQEAIRLFILQWQEWPVTLMVSSENYVNSMPMLDLAQKLYMGTIAISGFPQDAWAVSGPKGVVYSPGA